MIIDIPEELLKYVVLDEKKQKIESFKCPVCKFTTKLGPGALRMHLLLKADPTLNNRHDVAHEEYFREHQKELGLNSVRILSSQPRTDMGLS
jgi:hypothetical protein